MKGDKFVLCPGREVKRITVTIYNFCHQVLVPISDKYCNENLSMSQLWRDLQSLLDFKHRSTELCRATAWQLTKYESKLRLSQISLNISSEPFFDHCTVPCYLNIMKCYIFSLFNRALYSVAGLVRRVEWKVKNACAKNEAVSVSSAGNPQ